MGQELWLGVPEVVSGFSTDHLMTRCEGRSIPSQDLGLGSHQGVHQCRPAGAELPPLLG